MLSPELCPRIVFQNSRIHPEFRPEFRLRIQGCCPQNLSPELYPPEFDSFASKPAISWQRQQKAPALAFELTRDSRGFSFCSMVCDWPGFRHDRQAGYTKPRHTDGEMSPSRRTDGTDIRLDRFNGHPRPELSLLQGPGSRSVCLEGCRDFEISSLCRHENQALCLFHSHLIHQ